MGQPAAKPRPQSTRVGKIKGKNTFKEFRVSPKRLETSKRLSGHYIRSFRHQNSPLSHCSRLVNGLTASSRVYRHCVAKPNYLKYQLMRGILNKKSAREISELKKQVMGPPRGSEELGKESKQAYHTNQNKPTQPNKYLEPKVVHRERNSNLNKDMNPPNSNKNFAGSDSSPGPSKIDARKSSVPGSRKSLNPFNHRRNSSISSRPSLNSKNEVKRSMNNSSRFTNGDLNHEIRSTLSSVGPSFQSLERNFQHSFQRKNSTGTTLGVICDNSSMSYQPKVSCITTNVPESKYQVKDYLQRCQLDSGIGTVDMSRIIRFEGGLYNHQ